MKKIIDLSPSKNENKDMSMIKEDQWLYDTYLSAKQKANVAYIFAGIFGLIAILLAIALIFITPLKTSEPFLIYGDSSTGQFERIQKIADEPITQSEVDDRYWVGKYVTLREKFFYETAKDDFDNVSYLSSEEIAKEWSNFFHPAYNEESPVTVYGKKYTVNIFIKSITRRDTNVYQVRFKKTVTSRDGKASTKDNHLIANVVFRYNNDEDLTESYLLLNPRGFQVIAYEVNQDNF